MISTNPVRSRLSIGLALAFAALACFAIHASTAAALSPQQPKSSGHATFTLKAKTVKALKRAGVKVKAIGPAKVKRQGKAAQVKMPVGKYWGSNGKRADVSLKGGVEFKKGKRSFRLDMLNVATHPKRIGIGGRVAPRVGKRMPGVQMTNIFNVNGKRILTSNSKFDRIQIRNGKASLTKGVAKAIRKHLKVKPSLAKAFGKFTLNAKRTTTSPPVDPCIANPAGPGCVPVNPCESDPTATGCPDPYLAQCDFPANTITPGNAPAAAPLPALAGAAATTGSDVNWGLMSSFRDYIQVFGSMHGLDGATMNASGFTFPSSPGKYQINDPADTSDDQAIINGTGTALFCNKAHFFRIALSNPTIVIDGDVGRLVVDVDTNTYNEWVPTQRVDLATLDLSAVTPNYSENAKQVTWSDIPATLTQVGSDTLRLCNENIPGPCPYAAGATLDPVTVQAKTAVDVAFPLADSCDLTQQFGVTGDWPGVPANPEAAPQLTAPVDAVSGGLDWGINDKLRQTVSSPGGQFNLVSPATKNDSNMVGSGKYFTWPSTQAQFDAGGSGGADDRLVMRGEGTVAMCQTAHGFGLIVSNPVAIVDGTDSRISADVTMRFGKDWSRGNVDLVNFDAADAVRTGNIVGSNAELSWTWADPTGTPAVGPVHVGPGGAAILSPLGASFFGDGAVAQGLTIRAVVPSV